MEPFRQRVVTNSERKFIVETIIKASGADWVQVRFNQTGQGWVPSFEDLFRIVNAIAICEEKKYPQPRFRGWRRVGEFLVDACDPNATYGHLAEKYKLPVRQGGVTVKTNGAKLPAFEKVAHDSQQKLPGII
jgi:hypothetical protein